MKLRRRIKTAESGGRFDLPGESAEALLACVRLIPFRTGWQTVLVIQFGAGLVEVGNQ